jgi:hypothetical protein
MINNTDNLLILGIIILIGIYILKKKVETYCWIFTILYYWLIFILLLIISFYNNFINNSRIKTCLASANSIIKHLTILPVYKAKVHLMSKPFSEFLISTSHNTYLPCTQNGDISSVDAITNALKLGARVIELDVFAKNNTGKSPDDFEPVVAHGIELSTGNIFTTSFIYFKDCIETIKTFASTTSDPIWIDIELNTNNIEQTQKIMRAILLDNFSTKILGPEFKIGNKIKNFSTEPINNLLNKIIITTSKSKKSITKYLIDIFDSYANDEYYTNNSADTIIEVNKIKQNKIHRVYPPGNFSSHFSHNYDPEPFWKKHIQLVALNFQTVDINFKKNLEMFKSCSFVHFSELS